MSALKKTALALLFILGAFAADITFTSTTPDGNDSSVILHQKLLQAINQNTIARLQSASSTSTATPEAAVTASPGAGHYDTLAKRFYIKSTGVGDTGWVLIFQVQ